MSESVEKILSKHLLRYFKLSPTNFSEGADKEGLAKWMSKKLVEDGWLRVTSQIRRQTLHPLHLDAKFIGAKVIKGTENILPKNSILAILSKGDEPQQVKEHPRPDFEGM